jgi:Mg2+-importing ATPase
MSAGAGPVVHAPDGGIVLEGCPPGVGAVAPGGRSHEQPFVAVAEAATGSGTDILGRLGSAATGLTDDEAARRRVRVGPNAVRTHRVSASAVLVRQPRSTLLGYSPPWPS